MLFFCVIFLFLRHFISLSHESEQFHRGESQADCGAIRDAYDRLNGGDPCAHDGDALGVNAHDDVREFLSYDARAYDVS